MVIQKESQYTMKDAWNDSSCAWHEIAAPKFLDRGPAVQSSIPCDLRVTVAR